MSRQNLVSSTWQPRLNPKSAFTAAKKWPTYRHTLKKTTRLCPSNAPSGPASHSSKQSLLGTNTWQNFTKTRNTRLKCAPCARNRSELIKSGHTLEMCTELNSSDALGIYAPLTSRPALKETTTSEKSTNRWKARKGASTATNAQLI